MAAPRNRQEAPPPHPDWVGRKEVDAPSSKSLVKMARLWRPVETFLELAACTLARYALRVIDRQTGIPYSADELKTWILADAGAGGSTDTIATDPGDGNAPEGGLGEYFETSVSIVPGVDLSNDLAAAIVSILLPAGDWDVEGTAIIKGVAATVTSRLASISGDNGVVVADSKATWSVFSLSNGIISLPITRRRLLLSEEATIYLNVSCSFTGAANIQAGAFMTARRAR